MLYRSLYLSSKPYLLEIHEQEHGIDVHDDAEIPRGFFSNEQLSAQ